MRSLPVRAQQIATNPKKLMPMDYILKLTCPDGKGIVAGVSGILAAADCNILDSDQYGDPDTDLFFMRVHFQPQAGPEIPQAVHDGLAGMAAAREGMRFSLHDCAQKPRVAVLASRQGHCLNDLLYRYRTGWLHCDIPLVISNHRDFYQLAAWHDVEFRHLPVSDENRAEQEAEILALVESHNIDLVVLARYMQILSPQMAAALAGRCINIHHSFLPSFKGARPYHQAHARGVKQIGATAHYVTAELDDGPIIEQQTERVSHAMTAQDYVRTGQDIEAQVLARAVQWHLQARVFINGNKTVVFRRN